jgi:crotonobetainyl-CoA:carnitine CoA-transferase CaiB-like acyl-CoA transferase
MGNAHLSIVPYQDFPTADGDMILAIGNDGQFARFCEVAGRAEWAQDARFATNTERVRHRQTLIPLLRQTTVLRTTAEWVQALEAHAVPCGPINRIDQVFAEPQVLARGMAVTLQHPRLGPLQVAGSPLKLSASPVRYRQAPPDLGAHRDEVLRDWLGATEPPAPEHRGHPPRG